MNHSLAIIDISIALAVDEANSRRITSMGTSDEQKMLPELARRIAERKASLAYLRNAK